MARSLDAGSSGEAGLSQDGRALRDAYTAGRDVNISVHPPTSEVRSAGGRGLLWPPLGRLPERVRGRDLLVARLNALVVAPDGRAHVLAGLGGTGKSTVALRLAEIALEQGRPVWWVPGVDQASLTSALLGLAQSLGADAGAVEAARAGRADACDVVWAQLEMHPGWVLVIDNADDLRALEVAGRRARDGNAWIRGSRTGLVIVTSRTSDTRAWGRAVKVHSVGWLSDEDGGQVLLDLAPHAGKSADAEALSARLGGLALALHHAGSQLSSPFAAAQTFAGYQEALQTQGAGVLGPPDAVDDREVVTRTWELSLRQLAQAGMRQARDLLGVLAWFAGAVPIPIGGLDRQMLGRMCQDAGAAGVGTGLEALMSVGLIETSASTRETGPELRPGPTGVMVHPLVAETIRHELSSRDAAGAAASVAVDLMAAATSGLTADNPRDWPLWSAWLPHLEELLTTAAVVVEDSSLAALANASPEDAATLAWAGSYAASLAAVEEVRNEASSTAMSCRASRFSTLCRRAVRSRKCGG